MGSAGSHRRAGLVPDAAHDRHRAIVDDPRFGHDDLEAAHHRHDVDDRLLARRDDRAAQVDLASAHDRDEIAAAKRIGGRRPVAAAENADDVDAIAGVAARRLIFPLHRLRDERAAGDDEEQRPEEPPRVGRQHVQHRQQPPPAEEGHQAAAHQGAAIGAVRHIRHPERDQRHRPEPQDVPGAQHFEDVERQHDPDEHDDQAENQVRSDPAA